MNVTTSEAARKLQEFAAENSSEPPAGNSSPHSHKTLQVASHFFLSQLMFSFCSVLCQVRVENNTGILRGAVNERVLP